MKEIEKYIGYYLLVYLVVLAICGFFQYMSVCQGESLMCAVSIQGLIDILTVTAYVLTPIVAIIGFLNWKEQHNKLLLSNLALKVVEKLRYVINTHEIIYNEINKFYSGKSLSINLSRKIVKDYIQSYEDFSFLYFEHASMSKDQVLINLRISSFRMHEKTVKILNKILIFLEDDNLAKSDEITSIFKNILSEDQIEIIRPNSKNHIMTGKMIIDHNKKFIADIHQYYFNNKLFIS